MSSSAASAPSSARGRAILGVLVVLAALFGIHALLTSILAAFLFHPSGEPPLEPRPGLERVSYVTSDGVRLSGWLVRARGERRRTVVSFHGNAATAANTIPWGEWLASEGADVLLAEYRGYGESEGAPSASGIERDAEAAVRFVLDVLHRAPSELVVYGQSLGGAAAIAALAGPARGAAGGIVESSFTSLHDMARVSVGLPLTYLIPDAYSLNSLARASEVRAPILALHGASDHLIPFAQGRRLAQALRARRFVAIERGEHNLERGQVEDAIRRFLDEVTP